jgi:sugar porter (SP) family MFS transporter
MKNRYTLFIAFVVSLGGFLFGFDAGIISGVMSYAGPEFGLNDTQTGWVVSSPSFAAMIAMLISGRLSDRLGRKKILLGVAFLYAFSALTSAYAVGYNMLWIARMIGGIAFGAALILAPTYIAEISTAKNRGKLVSIQQLNIVFGFFAAFLCNYYLNEMNVAGSSWLSDENVWRWMLGLEFFPAILYFIFLFFVPRSPRWLFMHGLKEEAQSVLAKLHGKEESLAEGKSIEENIEKSKGQSKVRLGELWKPALRFIVIVGLVIGVLQQITGINAIYFYATSIFKQTGIGTNAAFASGVLMSSITVLFTILAIFLIDKMGRRPLLIYGIAGISISLLLCAYSFYGATYSLKTEDISAFEFIGETEKNALMLLSDKTFDHDVTFKNEVKALVGKTLFDKNEGAILEAATSMNSQLALIGILGFIACFAFSLGPVMWVMLSELYPNRYRGLAIGAIGFVNSFASWVVQQVFPWELSNLGTGTSFLIFGLLGAAGFFILAKILPETKGKSLEEIEQEFAGG